MKTRILTSVVGILLLVGVMMFFDTIFFNLVIAAVCLIAIHEIYNAFQFETKSLYLFIGFVPVTLLILLSDYVSARYWVRPMSYVFVVFLAICIIAHSRTLSFAKVSGMAVFSAIVIFCFYSLIYLKALLPREAYHYDAAYFFVLILGFAWGGDTTAYFVGRAFGKHKLAPVVSPKKTVEGAIGGVLGSMAVGLLITFVYTQIFGHIVAATQLRGGYYAILLPLGAVASVLGIVGDLFASAVKRQCGIKDYGAIFPGHGGILDRFDSVLFIAPLVSIVVTVVFYWFRV